MLDPLAAGVLAADAVDDVDVDALVDDAADEDEPELHPAIRASTAAAATPPAAMCACLSLNMVLTHSFEGKTFGATLHPRFVG
jgi:hypothetical protein